MAAILLVEDVSLVRTTLRRFLERGGHVVEECGSGDDARAFLVHRQVDAVVTDLWMRDGDGLSLIAALRADGRTVPVIAITGGDPRSPLSSSADAAAKAGADRVLMKPVTKTLLLDSIEAVLVPAGVTTMGGAQR